VHGPVKNDGDAWLAARRTQAEIDRFWKIKLLNQPATPIGGTGAHKPIIYGGREPQYRRRWALVLTELPPTRRTFRLPECCRYYHRRTPPPPPHTCVSLDHPASKGLPLATKAQSIADYGHLLGVALYLHRLFLRLPGPPIDPPAKAEAESRYAAVAPLILTQGLTWISIQRQKALADPSVNPTYENLARREANSAIRKAIRRVEKTRAWQRLFDDAATADALRRIFYADVRRLDRDLKGEIFSGHSSRVRLSAWSTVGPERLLYQTVFKRSSLQRIPPDDLQVPRWWPMHWSPGVYVPYGTNATTRVRPKPHLHQVEYGNKADAFRFQRDGQSRSVHAKLEIVRTVSDSFCYNEDKELREANN
jgi:hypothetical protein